MRRSGPSKYGGITKVLGCPSAVERRNQRNDRCRLARSARHFSQVLLSNTTVAGQLAVFEFVTVGSDHDDANDPDGALFSKKDATTENANECECPLGLPHQFLSLATRYQHENITGVNFFLRLCPKSISLSLSLSLSLPSR